MNAWVLLALAILCEIAGTSLLKASQGFAKPLFGVASMSCYGLCFWLLAFAFTRIPMGIAYAIWSGLGIVLISVAALVIYGQKLDVPAMLGMAMIVGGVVVIQLFSKTAGH